MVRLCTITLIPRWGSEIVANYKEVWFQWLGVEFTRHRPVDMSNLVKLRRKNDL